MPSVQADTVLPVNIRHSRQQNRKLSVFQIHLTPGEQLCSWKYSPVINTGFFGCLKLSKTLLCIEILNSCFDNSFCEKKIRVTKHLMKLMNETTPHHVNDTYHLTVVRYFGACTQYKRSIHFPIIVIMITPLDGAQCCSWPETFKVSSTELFTFLKARFPKDWLSYEKDLGTRGGGELRIWKGWGCSSSRLGV